MKKNQKNIWFSIKIHSKSTTYPN